MPDRRRGETIYLTHLEAKWIWVMATRQLNKLEPAATELGMEKGLGLLKQLQQKVAWHRSEGGQSSGGG